jgi:hypothetical protein
MLARKPELRQHTRAWKVASNSRSLSHTAKIGSGSTVPDTTAGTASAGKAAAEATIERRDNADIFFRHLSVRGRVMAKCC